MSNLHSKRLRHGVAGIFVVTLSACAAEAPAPRHVVVMAPVVARAAPVVAPAPLPVSKPYEIVVAAWPPHAKAAALAMIQKYGPPSDTSGSELTWYKTGPFKRTVVHRVEVAHNFPTPHVDVLEQVVALTVPADKIAELAAFDGSLGISRTAGEVSSTSESEAMNYLTLNLANEIIIGHSTAEAARKAYLSVAVLQEHQGPQAYATSLIFPVQASLGDPDQDLTATPVPTAAVPTTGSNPSPTQAAASPNATLDDSAPETPHGK